MTIANYGYAAQGNHILTNNSWLNDPQSQENLKKGLTAFIPLDDAFVSIASRIHLIRNAQHSIDLQYYIWNNDYVGQLMLKELLKAADRGVKIRLIIDDQNGNKLDPTLRALSQHPNFQIKLFNPYQFRHFRVLDYLFRLKQINHRMHNKLILADNMVAVTGGRNISGEYFDASDEFQFTDLDILFYGDSAQHATQVFNQFWNNALSVPVHELIGRGNSQDLQQLKQDYERNNNSHRITQDKINEAQAELNEALQLRSVQWAKAHFVADAPDKILDQAVDQQLIYNQMLHIMGYPTQHLELVSAYFVPTPSGTQYLSQLCRQGVKVRVLTNSFAANDVAIVHAFYSQYRKQLLENGVKLYEFKPTLNRTKPTWYEKITGRVIPAKGKSSSSLHAKFFDIDGKVFIGSFNFDPRSAYLNTEVGLVVESDQLQNEITQVLDEYLPQVAYELQLDKQGNIIWVEHKENGETKIYDHDPGTTKFQRFMMKMVAYLPIEWMM
ncbi:phospholipase D family protein [Acinetobacter ihumii]|uniref:phospholipase D family protein n=1 Tax=Acinetobacter ihumii TaxID=2483802 RepID=UPI001D192EC6|nr:phospholipase D family protein [Acinetobacter ihumii]